MDRKDAEDRLLRISEYKCRIEKAIKDTLALNVDIEFRLKEGYDGYYVIGTDLNGDICLQMTATPFLRQLFASSLLRIIVWEDETCFTIPVSVDYSHNYGGGRNGHDLMKIVILKEDGAMFINK